MTDAAEREGPRIAFAGGGTGGHLVPGLHLLASARAEGRAPADLVWFRSGRAVEDRALAGLADLAPGAESVALALEPPGGGAPGLARLARHALPAAWRARRALVRHRTQVVLGLGGFTSLPAVLAARSLGVPCALLEVNAVPGRATRTLSRLVRRVYHASADSMPAGAATNDGARHRVTGAPLDPRLSRPRLEKDAKRALQRELGLPGTGAFLLVLGGSQGAGSLNAFLGRAAKALDAAGVEVLHQCGPGRRAEAPKDGARLLVREYLDDVPELLRAADLVLCRGGASTLAEVAAARVPALVVPYPHHADRHQERNARALGEGARIVPDDALDAAFTEELVRLCGRDGARWRSRATDALRDAMPTDAARVVWDDLIALAGER